MGVALESSASRRRQSIDEPNARQPVDDEASQKVQWADELRAATIGQQASSPGLQQIVQASQSMPSAREKLQAAEAALEKAAAHQASRTPERRQLFNGSA